MEIANKKYDAIVIGSGISGGLAAMELTKNGLEVILIDRGRNIEHIKDYNNALKETWNMPHRGIAPKSLLEDFPVTSRVYNKINEFSSDFFTKDKLHPYIEKKRFDWIRGYQLGGKSITWGRIALRFSEIDFEANLREGIGIDWPIRYKDLEPWYSYVEKFIGVAGNTDNIPHLPDGIFQPPMPLTCVEEDFKYKLSSSKYPSQLIHARQAHLTAPTEEQLKLGRGKCQYRNRCNRGCPFGAYFSTQSSTLVAAKLTNKLTVATNSIVKEIIYDDITNKAIGVLIVDAITKREYTIQSKIIFLNASTLGSTQILLNSKSKSFPNGLGNTNGTLGHYLMDHHFGAGATAEVEGFEDKTVFGRRPNGFYIPRYQNIGNDKRDYLRGFGYEGDSKRVNSNSNDIGVKLKEAYTKPGPWQISLSAFAETLPYEDNFVFLDENKKDEWGIPQLVISAEFKENESKMRNDMVSNAAEMFELAGYRNIKTYNEIRGFGRCIHEMGTARMGKDSKTSILNSNNQIWDVKNVFVTDGACMTSSSNVNPSLTYMALTARACDFAVKELKRGNL
jgi:choline dehydrogenase-like flavoprotein